MLKVKAAPLPCSPRQAITTRYIGPTNYRPARVKAICAAGSVIVPFYDDVGDDYKEPYIRAVRTLLEKLGWTGVWAMGTLVSGEYVFVKTNVDTTAIVCTTSED